MTISPSKIFCAKILFAGISSSGYFVRLDGVRISPCHRAAGLIFPSSFHHGSLGHDRDPYMLGK